MDSVKDFASQWTKCEKEYMYMYTRFDWAHSVRSYIQVRINKLNASMLTHATSILKDINVYLSRLHNKYVAVHADKTSNNIVLCVNHIT